MNESEGTIPSPGIVLRQEMKPQERQDLPDDLARGLAVMEQVEGVRSLGMIHDRQGEIASQGLDHETVERFVQARTLVSTGSGNEQRQIPRKVLDGFSRARIDEPERPCRLDHGGRPLEVQHVPVAKDSTL